MLPEDVYRIAQDVKRIFWIVPTKPFLLEHYPKRGEWVQGILRDLYPKREQNAVFINWMNRDALMAEQVAARAERLGIPVLRVDGKQSIQENATIVMQHFASD